VTLRPFNFAEPRLLWNLLQYLYNIYISLPPQRYSFSTIFPILFLSFRPSILSKALNIQRGRMQMQCALLFSAHKSPYMERGQKEEFTPL
jgi:hypothetical protein